jgi:hypothetical protein
VAAPALRSLSGAELGPEGGLRARRLGAIAALLLGILARSLVLVLSGVIADVTVAELGGFKAMNER